MSAGRLTLAVLACLLAAAPQPAHAADGAGSPVIGLRPERGGDAYELVRLRPRTLAAAARPIRLRDSEPMGYAVSPDGRRVAVATASGGARERSRVSVVSVRGWRRGATVRLPARGGSVVAVKWLRPDRVLAFQRSVSGDGALRITVIDPLAGRIVTRTQAPEGLGGPRAVGERIALFDLAEDGRTNLVAFLDADAREVGRLDAGDLSGALPNLSLDGSTVASATVDPATGHVLLLAATAPALVDVDPATLTATRRTFAAQGPEGATQTWVEGAADERQLAFTYPADQRGRSAIVPVDRATLTPGRAVTVSGFNPPEGAGDRILVPSSSLTESSLKGLRAYDLTGRRLWTAERGHRTTAGRRYGDVVYADVQGAGSTILDAATGKTLGRGPRRPLQIFERMPAVESTQPWFGFGGVR